MSESAPRNRRERRAAAKENRAADSIPMAQPDRTKPKSKTLFEIAAEREAALRGRSEPAFSGVAGDTGEPTVVTINPDGSLSGPDGEVLSPEMNAKVKASMESGSGGSVSTPVTDDPAGLFAEAALYTFTLCIIHFTFSVLVHHQYGLREELSYKGLAWNTLELTPILTAVVFALHPRANLPWAQGLFLLMSIAAGCWLVYASSNMPYMAVMKRAPGAGTIWIWSALESRAEVAVLGVAVVAGYFWYGGFSIYD